MIKQYDGAKAEKAAIKETLPAGAYVADIKNAEVVNYDWGEVLLVSFDIAEGDFKGFFANDYRANTSDNRKWRGTYRATIPDEKSQYFDNQKRTFNGIMYALEDSNDGYRFDWDETKLKGKKVGVAFRNKEWEYEGKSGWTTECAFLCDVESVRNGSVKLPKDKPLNSTSSNATSSAAPTPTAEVSVDDDFPF